MAGAEEDRRQVSRHPRSNAREISRLRWDGSIDRDVGIAAHLRAALDPAHGKIVRHEGVAGARRPKSQQREQKIGSIPRILSPQETERFMGEQYETYAKLAAQLRLELK